MGIDDRDYMRERARDRAETRGAFFAAGRRRSRKGGLEVWLEAPFRSQKAALAISLVGLALISGIPASVIASMSPAGPVDLDPATMMDGMVRRGVVGGAMTLVPILRIVGLALIVSSGIALIMGRRRWGYSTVVRDPNVASGIGAFLLTVAAWIVFAHGLWQDQVKRAAEAATSIATGRPSTPERDMPAQAAMTVGTAPSQTLTPSLATAPLPSDRPFPANGTFERSLPLQGKIARMAFANRSQNNAIVLWLYNLNDGKGDHEALRLYVAAGQSAAVDLPAFDYRMAIYEAPTALGLDRGFGPDARPKDLGLVDLKTPANALSQQPSGSYLGYGIHQFRPGVYAARR